MSKQAWVTLATNDSYGLGALVLAHSLRRVGSSYPSVVLITPSVTDAMRERLRAVFAEVVIVDVLDSRDAAHLALLQRPELGITFTKIHCWNLTQYEKAVFLDADTFIVQNCDELFEREELSAAPDVGWPDCFNSGVFVFRPSAETFSNLITFASERGSFDGGDQGLLNSYFSDWAHGDINKHLPFLYNVTSAAFYSYLPALKHFGQNLKIIHFIGAIKPWLQQFNWESRSVEAPEHLRGYLQLWWNVFIAEVHSQLDVTMGIIEDDTSAEEEELNDYREPVLHDIYYEPAMDAGSEFPWHHPDNQIPDLDIDVPEIDLSQHHDPWNIYRGNIPPDTEQSPPKEQTFDDYQDMRKYAWDYMPPQHSQSHHSHEQIHFDKNRTSRRSSIHSQHKQEHFTLNSESQNDQNSDNKQLYIDHNYDNTHMHTLQSYNEQQISRHDHQQPQYSHENHYSYYDQSENMQNKSFEHNFESLYTPENLDKQDKTKIHIKGGKYYPYPQFENQQIKVYSVMMDHVKTRCHHRSEVNGYRSDSDSDLDEKITPRHPYDGFYLRHRMTIDSRGKKICIHEIPLIPRTPTPDSSEEFEDAIEEFPEELIAMNVNNEDCQTGVAGNLARVVPGAPLQREAVDELARRQGWEAGNIDYMGADSFDNIWAKISHTLSQPPAQPEQPSESQQESVPQQQSDPPVEASQEPVAEKETVLATPEEKPVEEPSAEVPKPVETAVEKVPEPAVPEVPVSMEPAAPEVPVSTEPAAPEVPVSTEPAAPEVPVSTEPTAPEVPVSTEPAAPEVPVSTEPVPVEVPTPASEATLPPGKIEEPIPIPAEIAAEETPVVEVAADVTSSSPAEVLEKTDDADIPVTALEALKIDEPVAEAPAVTEPAQVAVESKPEVVAKPETGSDSPPLANTPSKEEIPATPAAKSEERRKPAGKLQLRPPPAADALPTPDSELEDAAALAHAIIAAELRAPTVAAPSPPTPSPAPSSAAPLTPPALSSDARLSVQKPEVPTPPVSAVSLSQIGVKPKPSTAAQIESSVTVKTEADAPKLPESEAPRKKLVKKAVKKDKEGASNADAPVPPPRKKEKKPKEK